MPIQWVKDLVKACEELKVEEEFIEQIRREMQMRWHFYCFSSDKKF